MDFPTWLASQPRGTRKRLDRESKGKISYTSLCRAAEYIPLGPKIAELISAATGGDVPKELISFPPPMPDDVAKARAAKKRERIKQIVREHNGKRSNSRLAPRGAAA